MRARSLAGFLASQMVLAIACDPQPAKDAVDAGPSAALDRGRSNDARAVKAVDEPARADEPRSGAKVEELGRVTEDGLIRVDAILGKTPAEVDALLGVPTQTGTPRVSCVRFLPERVFFACKEEVRVYEGAQSRLKLIEVDFEDGRAAAVALIGLPGEGEFGPVVALTLAGLKLPGEPQVSQPTSPFESESASVTVWSYSNSSARLLLDGLQYRVEISIVDDDWARSKVKVLVNHPLDEDQLARVKPVKSG